VLGPEYPHTLTNIGNLASSNIYYIITLDREGLRVANVYILCELEAFKMTREQGHIIER
jgi:hypothetical protein